MMSSLLAGKLPMAQFTVGARMNVYSRQHWDVTKIQDGLIGKDGFTSCEGKSASLPLCSSISDVNVNNDVICVYFMLVYKSSKWKDNKILHQSIAIVYGK